MSSESRIWENRPFGSMRGGSAMVIGHGPLNPSAPAYSTEQRFSFLSPFPLFAPVESVLVLLISLPLEESAVAAGRGPDLNKRKRSEQRNSCRLCFLCW